MRARISFSRSRCQQEAWLFFFRGSRLHGVEIGPGPEGRGQLGKAQTHVEVLGGLHDLLGRPVLEVGVEVHPLHEAGPVLAPPVVDPVGGNRLGDGLPVLPRPSRTSPRCGAGGRGASVPSGSAGAWPSSRWWSCRAGPPGGRSSPGSQLLGAPLRRSRSFRRPSLRAGPFSLETSQTFCARPDWHSGQDLIDPVCGDGLGVQVPLIRSWCWPGPSRPRCGPP